MNHHTRVNVFGHRLGAEAADFGQHTTAEQAAASRKERTIVMIPTTLQNTVEQRLLILQKSIKLKIFLKHIRVIKVVRRLDKRDLFILKEPDRILQKTTAGNMVDVEDRDNFSRRL